MDQFIGTKFKIFINRKFNKYLKKGRKFWMPMEPHENQKPKPFFFFFFLKGDMAFE